MKYQFHTINFASFLGGTASVEALLYAAAEAGFGSVAIDQFALDRFLEGGHSLSRLRSLLDDLALHCDEASGLVFGPDASLDAPHSARVVEVAAALGNRLCGAMVTVPVDAALVERIRPHVESMAAADVRVAFEFTPYLPMGSLAQAQWLCHELGLRGAGLLVDSWHVLVGPDGVTSLREVRAEEIATVQFDDAGPVDRDDLAGATRRRVMPGDGVLDVDGFVAAVAATGYDGTVALEVLNPAVAGGDPARFAKDAMCCLQRYWPAAARSGAPGGDG